MTEKAVPVSTFTRAAPGILVTFLLHAHLNSLGQEILKITHSENKLPF